MHQLPCLRHTSGRAFGLLALLVLLAACSSGTAPAGPGQAASSNVIGQPTTAPAASGSAPAVEPAVTREAASGTAAGEASAAPTPLPRRTVKGAYPSVALSQMEFMFAIELPPAWYCQIWCHYAWTYVRET